jgi:hypothetical protein
LVQPELEKRSFPLVKVPPLRGGDFQGMGVYRPMRLPDYEYAAREWSQPDKHYPVYRELVRFPEATDQTAANLEFTI